MVALLAISPGLCGQAQAQPDTSLEARQAATAEFRARVQFEVGRYRGAYPRTAYAAGQEGTVLVQVNVDEAGAKSVDVKTSSGYGNLDARALALVKVAAADAKVPPGVRGTAFSVDVPVVFSLARRKN